MKFLFAFVLLSLPISVFADGGLPTQPYIYAEGTADVEKPPDFVGLNFRVVGRAADRPKANEQCQAKVVRVMALLKEAKIAGNDIVAEDLSSEPQFDESVVGRRKLTGYAVTRPIYVRVRDIPSFAGLVDRLIGLDGIEFARIEGGLIKQKEIEEGLGEQALVNARERADKTVKAIGMKIDSVFAVSPVRFPDITTKLITDNQTVIVTGSAAPQGQERVEPSEYRLAPVMVSRSVHVIYLIAPAK